MTVPRRDSEAVPKPYWIDEFEQKHEAYFFGEPDSRIVSIEHQGRTIKLIAPQYVPPFSVREVMQNEGLLLLIGERLDEEDVEGEIIEGGDGVLIVGRRHPERDETFWAFVYHALFPETLRRAGSRQSRS